MKRTSAITQLLTVLLLAGFSQNEVTDVNPDSHPAVGFGVYTGLATRGVDMTTESMKDSPSDAEKYGGLYNRYVGIDIVFPSVYVYVKART